MSPENEEKSSPEKENILQFQFPEQKKVDVFLVKLTDGTIIARTKDELKKEEKK